MFAVSPPLGAPAACWGRGRGPRGAWRAECGGLGGGHGPGFHPHPAVSHGELPPPPTPPARATPPHRATVLQAVSPGLQAPPSPTASVDLGRARRGWPCCWLRSVLVPMQVVFPVKSEGSWGEGAVAPGADPQPGPQSQPPTRLVTPPLPAAPVDFLVHENQFLPRFCRVHKRLWHQLAFVLSLPFSFSSSSFLETSL